MRAKPLVVVLAVAASVLPAAASDAWTLRAGVGIADATWHVGAGAGQYTAKDPNLSNAADGGEIDPHSHTVAQRPSYGVQSRLTYRALVVEGSNGKRVALVKSDAYLAQDMLTRRVAHILAERNVPISYEQILLTASHNHSSPYAMSPSWGVWLFQDVMDLRAFEYHARQIAAAIEAGYADLRPARMGATVVEHRIYKGMIARAGIADDGTPRGYPESHGDFGLTVLRFEDVSDPRAPRPLAVWANWGQHPESNGGFDLISADYLGPLERMVERELGAPLIISQSDTGSAEGPYCEPRRPSDERPVCSSNEVLPDGVIRAWAHVGYAQTERGARYLADSIVEGWHAIGAGEVPVPMSSDVPVDSITALVPGPVSHPYPSVSNCRTETTVEGNPGSPILGLPDCQREGSTDRNAQLWEQLKGHGAPLPEHYDAPSYGAVQENNRIKLQVVRLGEVVLGSCSCEAQVDLILNFESRADTQPGTFAGYDWSWACAQNADTTWTCSHPSPTTFSDERYRRMQAQIHNPADGWDAPENAGHAHAEPSDPAQIKGNFGTEELDASLGYALPVGVGMAGDYNGYVVSYREYMAYDHYRKALTAWGPHTADYMVTRLVRMAGALKGGPGLDAELLDPFAQADEARMETFARAFGAYTSRLYDGWQATLPDDASTPAALEQPSDVTRFDAATFTWRGGSNAVDNPIARVERLVDGEWVPYADQSGEVQTMVHFPKGAQGLLDTYAGAQEWRWTASFEAFDAWPAPVVEGGQVPNGTYRFVVDGRARAAGVNEPYHLESEPFEVRRWEGIVVADAGVVDGDVRFTVEPIAYPRTYSSPFRFIRDDGNALLCMTCTFRPWARTGEVSSAEVTVMRAGGSVEVVPATLVDGAWVADTDLQAGDSAEIARGGVRDTFGEINGVGVPVA